MPQQQGEPARDSGELTHQDVDRLLELFERSAFDYLEVVVGGTRVVAGRHGFVPATAPPAGGPAAPAVQSGSAAAPAAQPAPAAPQPEPAAAPAQEPAEPGLVTVTAPVVGIFYRRPEPGAAPFVEPGAPVRAGETMALVEVMKMFNSVTAETDGVVAEVLVEDGALVEYGQPLFLLRPATG